MPLPTLPVKGLQYPYRHMPHAVFAVSVVVSFSSGGFDRFGQSVPLHVLFQSFFGSMAGMTDCIVLLFVCRLLLLGSKNNKWVYVRHLDGHFPTPL